jgi:hypothetical protein
MKEHPCETWGKSRGWNHVKTSEYLDINYSTYKRVVRGFAGVSVARAVEIQKKTRGKVQAIDVLLWHEAFRARKRKAAA